VKVIRAIGFIIIFAVVILNFVYLFLAESSPEIVTEFGIVLRSTFGTVTLWFTISLFILYIKQSGLPYKSVDAQKKLKYIAIIFALWTVSFLIKILIYSLASSDKDPSR
jgi:hypothetical protein